MTASCRDFCKIKSVRIIYFWGRLSSLIGPATFPRSWTNCTIENFWTYLGESAMANHRVGPLAQLYIRPIDPADAIFPTAGATLSRPRKRRLLPSLCPMLTRHTQESPPDKTGNSHHNKFLFFSTIQPFLGNFLLNTFGTGKF